MGKLLTPYFSLLTRRFVAVLLFPHRVNEAALVQLLNEARIDGASRIESLGARVAQLQCLEHELDALHVDVRNAVLEAGNYFVGRSQDFGVAVLREVGRDL